MYKYIHIRIHPYCRAKYIQIQLRPNTNTTKYKCIHIGIHPYYPTKDIYTNPRLQTHQDWNTSLFFGQVPPYIHIFVIKKNFHCTKLIFLTYYVQSKRKYSDLIQNARFLQHIFCLYLGFFLQKIL